ncbi:MAG: ABC transporter substrate-binding protein [Ardenticatenaceae bacterium]|nr:ABC transporter substrate-binding protein [Anaerolineales bacterium]MCB8922129.1 ABC transporter substrate-binding protein [Ardenticatenaceae bacterium]MCB8991109.1 ABC transporter substrate-binding protein [Ardenticatenaceae bacterium]MCB9005265.1 ABC transporter substrate-binding protein [Ardenticatenaceae bacterium]
MKRYILIILFLLLAGCAKEPEPMTMTFMAGFKPQANLPFVGVYVAQEKGFFADEGLTVDIQHSAGGGEHLQLLAAGEVQVTTQDAAVLLKRRADPGLPLVSIGLIGQRGQQAFVALADSGIATPADWEGHLVGFKGTPPPDLFAIMEATGVNEDDVELVNVGFDPRVLVEGLVDVYPVYKSNEPFTLRSWGYDLVQWDAADYGVPTLGLTYVATEELIAENPEMLARFMRAAMRGIAYAQENPDEAVQITLKYAEGADPELMRFMLDAELADFTSPVTEANGVGWQTSDQYQALADMLLTYDAIAAPVDVSQAFTNQFLQQK